VRKADPVLQRHRKEEILAAAQRCFVNHGFHRSTMAEVAKASGLSMGLLYRYFRNKEEIVLAVAAKDNEELIESIRDFGQAATLQLASTLWVKRALQLANDPDYAALACEIMAEASRHAELRKRFKADSDHVRDAMQAAIKTQQVAGNVSNSVDPASAAEFLLMVMDGAIGRGTLLGAAIKPGLQTKLASIVKRALAPQ
jgi:AcrR family transcriptional regulator